MSLIAGSAGFIRSTCVRGDIGGWNEQANLDVARTVRWYLDHQARVAAVTSGGRRGRIASRCVSSGRAP